MSPAEDPSKKSDDDDGNNKSSKSSSSWFSSWFSRDNDDMRNEIHEKLNQFDERKRLHEQKLMEQQRHMSQFLPPSFFPTPPGAEGEDSFSSTGRSTRVGGSNDKNGNSDKNPFRDFGHNFSNIDDIHREMQDFFDAAMMDRFMKPDNDNNALDDLFNSPESSNKGRPRWTSSSSSTVISSSNGSSYQIHQDSRSGAQINIQLPKENNENNKDVTVEVLHERPCVIQWAKTSSKRDETSGEEVLDLKKGNKRKQAKQQQHLIELNDFIDCSKISASISEVNNTLTVKAPVIKNKTVKEQEESMHRVNQSKPRSIPVSKN